MPNPPPLASTTVPLVIDEILRLANASSVLAAAKVQVTDGFPGTDEENDIFAVGGATFPTEGGSSEYVTIGSARLLTDYEVHCIASCYRGGGVEAQKPARDAAFAIFNEITDGVRASFLNGGPLAGMNVHLICVSSLELQQSDYTTATNGRQATITFAFRVKSRT